MTEHRMQWDDHTLIDQIISGQKTATVRYVNSGTGLDEFNTALYCGMTYSVYDRNGMQRCDIRLTGITLCTWGAIPESLWRRNPAASGAVSLEAFKADHWEYFGQPSNDFEFLALYFDRV